MTKSKGAKLLQELINKYGDFVVARMYDYYATRIIEDPNNPLTKKKADEVIIREMHASELGENGVALTSWEDLKRLEDIAKGIRPAEKYPVVVKASQDLYNSEEQKKLREKNSREFDAYMNNLVNGYTFRKVEDMYSLAKRSEFLMHNDVKDFGMAMDNHRKRK